MTKYDPYKGMKPYRGRKTLTPGQRQKWGAIAATSFGIYMYSRIMRQQALDGGLLDGGITTVEFSQPLATDLSVISITVAPGGSYSLEAPLSKTSPLHVSAHLSNPQHGRAVRVAPVINGDQELSNAYVTTTDVNGVASITFSAEDMSIIGADGRTSVKFKFVLDGDYTSPIMVECPIGA
jgi:hypothetical protein